MAFLKKKNKKSKKQSLLITLRSGSISFAVVDIKQEPNPYILYEESAPIEYDEKKGASEFICETENVLKVHLEKFISSAAKYFAENDLGELSYKEASVMCSAPWYGVITRDVVIQHDEPFELTEKKFESIISEQIENHAHIGKQQDQVQIIEKKITHVVLNGYELTNPFNKEATHLTISTYISYFEKKCHENMTQIITSNSSAKKVSYATQPLVTFETMRDALHTHHSYAHVHITTKNTEFTIVRQGAIAFIAQLPLGKKWLLDEYCSKTGCSVDVAVSSVKKPKEERDEASEKIIEEIEKEWTSELYSLLRSSSIQIPNHIYITGAPDTQMLITSFFKNKLLHEQLFSAEARIIVTPFDTSHMSSHVSWNNEQFILPTDVLFHTYFHAHKLGL